MKDLSRISLFFIYSLFCFSLGVMLSDEMYGSDKLIQKMYGYPAEDLEQEESVIDKIVMEQAIPAPQPQVEPVEQNNVLPPGYYVTLLNDHVTVYYMDKETMYLFTEIMGQDLPAEVQAALHQGIIMQDEGALFSFLESYTS